MSNAILFLPNVLRVVASLIVVAMTVRYFMLDIVMLAPIVTIAVLVALSFTFHRWPRATAGIALVPGILIPLFVLIGYWNGDIEIELVIFDWIIFLWLIVSAVGVLARQATERGDA